MIVLIRPRAAVVVTHMDNTARMEAAAAAATAAAAAAAAMSDTTRLEATVMARTRMIAHTTRLGSDKGRTKSIRHCLTAKQSAVGMDGRRSCIRARNSK